ncbi:hypothetical protein FOBRF1_012569 [Fusarium oxysporum]
MSDNPTTPEVQVDENTTSDSDSVFTADSVGATTSIASSVLKYKWKHGRRYHSDRAGQYSFPNDDQEQDRLDMIHHVFCRTVKDRLFLAPIAPEGLNVLDIGTGTGIWAIQFGDEHPSATVVGNDLSPIQPDWVPPNVKFIVDDVEAEWVEPIPYDYIHCRYMAGSIKDWPRLLRQAYANLKPGGWIELQETANTLYSEDDSIKPDNALVQMMDHLKLACDKIGRTMDPAPSFQQWAKEAGFASVKEERFKLPIGPWPKDERLKEIGTLMGVNMREGVAAFTAVLFTDVLGWSREEVELFNARVREASRDRSNVHAFPNYSRFQYTHPGWNDTINTYVTLPVSGWNGRFVGVGGGGWSTGDLPDLAQPASNGYAAVTTDGGHLLANRQELDWALDSTGNLNWPALQNFAAVSLDDAATLGKAVTAAYYGKKPRYSYWNGCSTGGRQGHMMAQRYPTQYNGVLATASAFNWDKFVTSEYWPQVVMHKLDYYPPICELNAITKAAIEACDQLDGVKDGVISNPDLCKFDPKSVVGKSVECTNPSGTIKISKKGAEVARLTWRGPETEDGKFLWYGLDRGADLSGLANTTCTSLKDCTSSPFAIAQDWLTTFLLQDQSASLEDLSHAEYSKLFRQSVNRFASVMGTSDPDLTDFKKAGGKLISWHGTADQLIPHKGSVDYYKRVLEEDSTATDYYRFFEAPGVGHCKGGDGWYPGSAFDALVKWVEHGKAPETLYAETVGTEKRRAVELCAYPKRLTYKGGNPDVASSFACK